MPHPSKEGNQFIFLEWHRKNVTMNRLLEFKPLRFFGQVSQLRNQQKNAFLWRRILVLIRCRRFRGQSTIFTYK